MDGEMPADAPAFAARLRRVLEKRRRADRAPGHARPRVGSPPEVESRVAAVRRATAVLLAAGTPCALSDARILVCAAAQIDRGALLRDPDHRSRRRVSAGWPSI